MAARRKSFLRVRPTWHPEREGTLVLAIDPGENQGYCLMRVGREGDPQSVLWLGTSLVEAEATLAAYRPGSPRLVVLVEDQYRGKASFASKTTLSQRAGYFAGYLRVPEECIHFVQPKDWYWAIGQGAGVTKPVCMERIRRALPVACGTRGAFDATVDAAPQNQLDVLAAVGIAWAYPFLTEKSLTAGQKMVKIKPKARPVCVKKRQSRRGKVAMRRAAGAGRDRL